jgi:hypothetical protein
MKKIIRLTENQLVKLVNKVISEAIIKPYDFSYYLEELKSEEGNINGFGDINRIFDGSNIHFSDFDEYYGTLTKEEEKVVAPKDLMLMGGVKFALYNTNIDSINVVVEPSIFFEYINSENNKKSFYQFLELVLRHESIHSQQVERMGKENYVLDASPTVNSKKYWQNPHEVMAYAQSLVDDLRNQDLNDDEIKELLRNQKNIKSWIYDVYKKVLSPEQFKKFMSYTYLYLMGEI